MSAVLRDRDRKLGTVGCCESSLLVELGRHLAVDDQHGLSVVVDVEQLRRQRIATVVALALPGIEVHSHRGTLRTEPRREHTEKNVYSRTRGRRGAAALAGEVTMLPLSTMVYVLTTV